MLTFKQCPLIWMFCSKTANNIINNINKRTLRLAYQMDDAGLEHLLQKVPLSQP